MNQTAGEFRRKRCSENRAVYNNTPGGVGILRSQTAPCLEQRQTFYKSNNTFYQSNNFFASTMTSGFATQTQTICLLPVKARATSSTALHRLPPTSSQSDKLTRFI